MATRAVKGSVPSATRAVKWQAGAAQNVHAWSLECISGERTLTTKYGGYRDEQTDGCCEILSTVQRLR